MKNRINPTHHFSLRLLTILFVCLVMIQTVPANAGDREFIPAPPDFAYEKLASGNPVLIEAASMSRQFGVTMGIYGGTVRDLFLGHAFSPISDLDLIYDSSEKNFPAFRDALIAVGKRYKGQVPSPDFHFDLSDLQSETSRQKLYHTEGITATKVGILVDGRMLDPTGLGVQDLRDRVFRYYPPTREFIELHNLGRFARDLIRLPRFRQDSASIELLRRSLARYADPNTPQGKLVREVVRRSRQESARLATVRGESLGGGTAVGSVAGLATSSQPLSLLFTFADFINPVRRDGRYQHNDLLDRLTPFFPLDMFVFDLFRSITQAESMDDLRRGIALLGIDRFLTEIGMGEEARIFMTPQFSRMDLFRLFRFPGYQPVVAKRPENFRQIWENRLRRYSYRVLFDMLASEFAPDAPERKILEAKRDDFLATGTWRVLNPDDDYPDSILGFLDADFNLKILPREKLQNSLSWFAATYLPLGAVTLQQVLTPSNPESIVIGALFGILAPPPSTLASASPASIEEWPRLGFSPEVSAINLTAPHSFRDLNGYLSYLVGPELIELYRDQRTTLAFFMADEQTTVRLLQDEGYIEVFRTNACGFSRRVRTLLAHDPLSDRVCLAQYGFHSIEQWLNHQARYAFLLGAAGSDPQEVGSGPLAPGKVLTWKSPETSATSFPDLGRLQGFLDTLNQPVDSFFIGFVNPLKNLLHDVRSHQIGDLTLKTGYLPQTGPASAPRRLVLALSAFGANYGSLPANVARVLHQRGLRNIVFLGTGGGLTPSDERFGWIAPDRVGFAGSTPGLDRPLIRFRNEAVNLPIPVVRRSGCHLTVPSPLVETRRRVMDCRRRTAVSVDCELYWVVRMLAEQPQPARLFAMINLTDFPIGDERDLSREEGGSISIENSPVQFERVKAALEATVKELSRQP